MPTALSINTCKLWNIYISLLIFIDAIYFERYVHFSLTHFFCIFLFLVFFFFLRFCIFLSFFFFKISLKLISCAHHSIAYSIYKCCNEHIQLYKPEDCSPIQSNILINIFSLDLTWLSTSFWSYHVSQFIIRIIPVLSVWILLSVIDNQSSYNLWLAMLSYPINKLIVTLMSKSWMFPVLWFFLHLDKNALKNGWK